MSKTFYSADHGILGGVDYADVCPDDWFDEPLRRCCDVYLADGVLSTLFDVETTKDRRLVNRRIDEARRVGDRVYYVEIYEHSARSVRIKDAYRPLCSFDSRLAGVIIVRAQAWKEEISPVFTSAFVAREMNRLARWAEAWLEGEIFEAYDDEGILGYYPSEEEALEALRKEIKRPFFEEGDFDCTVSYRLKPGLLAV